MSELSYEDGEDAELLVEQLLRREGWFTTPARTQRIGDDSAPMFVGESEKIIMPDLYAMRSGVAVWSEVKQFGKPVVTRKRDQEEHGIRSRKFEAYKRTARASGLPTYLFIFEEESGELLAADVSTLSSNPPINREACIAHYGELMSYFGRGEFTQVKLEKEHVPHSFGYSTELKTGAPLNETLPTANDLRGAPVADGRQ